MYSEIELLKLIKKNYKGDTFSLTEISNLLNIDRHKLNEELILLSSKNYLTKHSQPFKNSVKHSNGFQAFEPAYRLTNQGLQYIKSYVGKWIKHYIPLIISIIAILISLLSIYLQYIDFFSNVAS